MLALDHRGSFRKLFHSENPDYVGEKDIIDKKRQIIDAVKEQMSGILIDLDTGLPAYVDRTRPFLLPIEKTGYQNQGNERLTELQYTAEDLKNKNADGIKLLIYLNPKANNALKQLNIAKAVLNQCQSVKLPLFIEVITYPIGQSQINQNLVIDSVRMFMDANIIPDVFKLEFAGSRSACLRLTQTLGRTPWILLTRGVDFNKFKRQLEEAIAGGCQGFLAGRALWQDLLFSADLEQTLNQRFAEICRLFS